MWLRPVVSHIVWRVHNKHKRLSTSKSVCNDGRLGRKGKDCIDIQPEFISSHRCPSWGQTPLIYICMQHTRASCCCWIHSFIYFQPFLHPIQHLPTMFSAYAQTSVSASFELYGEKQKWTVKNLECIKAITECKCNDELLLQTCQHDLKYETSDGLYI